jgi:predicted ATPase
MLPEVIVGSIGTSAKRRPAISCTARRSSSSTRDDVRRPSPRANVVLARLWPGQGRQADARARLQPVYAWFTEGFHSADLRAAKTLLDALG